MIILPDEYTPDQSLAQLPSGLIVPYQLAFEREQRRKRMCAVDVFSGCGGMSLGAIQAGMEVIAAIENEPYAVMTYMCNLCRWGKVQLHFLEEKDQDRLERVLQKSFDHNKTNQLELSLAGTGWIAHQPDTTPHVSHIIMGDVRKLTGAQLLKWIDMEVGER